MSTSGDRITRTPGVCGGKACIAGHRIRVLDIVAWHEHQGMAPDEIDHIEEIRREMQAERAFAEDVRGNHPSLLEAKLRQERLEEAS